MVNCPNCDAVIDVDEDELDEGDTMTCDECGADLSVTGLDPIELETEEDEDEDEEEEDEDEEEEEEDFDYDEDEDEDEEEETEEEDWH
jgi:alpha-aminoadipate carrier protein LysW